jgi:hypothetical protein
MVVAQLEGLFVGVARDGQWLDRKALDDLRGHAAREV